MRSEMKLASFSWALILVVPFVCQFGFFTSLYLLVGFSCFVAGFFGHLIKYGKEKLEEEAETPIMEPCPNSHGLPSLMEKMKQKEEESSAAGISAVTGKRLTGSEQIDEALSDVIGCIMRDFLQSWYGRISEDQVFPQQVKSLLEKVLVKFAQRLHDVEWITYCTQTLTNDFGSHIRLYKRTQRELKEKGRPKSDLEKVFFDMELEMEGNIRREQICTDKEAEKDYLRQLSEVILFLMVPEEFKDNVFRHLIREILVNFVLLPTVDLLSDPDYINQCIIWMCKPNSYSFEFLQQSLRMSNNENELLSMLDPIDAESSRLRGRDSGGEDDAIIKSQLADLRFLRSICAAQLKAINKRDDFGEADGDADFEDNSERPEVYACSSFDTIVENNSVLSYFHKYLESIKSVQFLDIYHRLTGYRTSTEKYIYHTYLNRPASEGSKPPDWSTLREVANSVFAECARELDEVEPMGPFAGLRADFLDDIVKRVRMRLKNHEPPTKDMFEELRQAVGDILRDERVISSFKQSDHYKQLLIDFGYLPPDHMSAAEADVLLDEDDLIKPKPTDVLSDEGDNVSIGSADTASIGSNGSKNSLTSLGTPVTGLQQQALQQAMANTVIMADVYKSERTRDSEERAFAVYVISVTRLTETGQEQWEIYRRYSDFDDLHALISEKFMYCSYPKIPSLKLPPKRAFNNMKHEVVQQRQRELDIYLKVLLSANNLERYPELRPIIYQFLEPGVWEKKRGNMVRQVSTLRSTVRSAMANVKQSADGLMDLLTLDKRQEQREALAQQRHQQDAGKMTLGLDLDDPEEVPLRILLLLVEEVFDGRADFRRLLYQVLKRIVRTVFGNKMNAYIVETAQSIASSEQIAEYIRRFKEGLWPNGVLAEPKLPRDQATKMRTRVVCRAKMLGSVATELTQYLGTVSTRHGMCRLFDLFQHETLNRRFVYVLLEGWLQLMFPDNGLHKLIEKVNDPSRQGRKCDGGDLSNARPAKN